MNPGGRSGRASSAMAMSKLAEAINTLFEAGVLTGKEDERNECFAKDWRNVPEDERCYCAIALVEPLKFRK